MAVTIRCIMKFYGREQELEQLNTIRLASYEQAQMTVLVGRRRIGKTRLILKSFENSKYLYFFVAKKSEALLCEEFLLEVKKVLNIPIFGEIKRFSDVFALLVEYSKQNQLNLVIDEFQEFNHINLSIYSEVQAIWDRNKEAAKMNLILCGSVYSLMHKIFENPNEPLFGRATERIHLKAFNVATLKAILSEYQPDFEPKDLLAFYIVTGGVAKYVELLTDGRQLKYSAIIDLVFKANSLFIDEGKNLLVEEFGKDYQTYFSILGLISAGKTSRIEMESVLNKTIGGYLDKLETEYNIIRRVKPVFSKPESRTIKYFMDDNFLNFWFRFVYKYRSAVEIENFEYLKAIVNKDFDVFATHFLQKFMINKLQVSKEFNLIGTYWEKQNLNEIDIVAVNELQMKVLFAEVKIDKSSINLNLLKQKSTNLLTQFENFEITYLAFDLEDM